MRVGAKGMDYINECCEKLGKKHLDHLTVYGEGNDSRLTGEHETSSMTKFSYGVGNRAASVRIPTDTHSNNGKGYIEDRRPASNIDAYVVGAMMCNTIILEEDISLPLLEHYAKWAEFKKKTVMYV